jgi:hypothetical protein
MKNMQVHLISQMEIKEAGRGGSAAELPTFIKTIKLLFFQQINLIFLLWNHNSCYLRKHLTDMFTYIDSITFLHTYI